MVLNFKKRCSCVVYENQTRTSKKVMEGIHDGFVFQLIVAQTQSGKTGMMSSLAEMYKKAFSSHKIYVLSGLSSVDWKKQTISRFPEYVSVYHRNDLHKISLSDKSLVLVDEVQYASYENMTLSKMLKQAADNVRFVLVSATPNKIFDDLLLLSEEIKCRYLVMEPGKGYTGMRQLLDSGRLLQAEDLWVASAVSEDENAGVKRFNQKMISKSLDAIKRLHEYIETKFTEPKYHIIRTQYGNKGAEVRERVMNVFGSSYAFFKCDSTTDYDIMNMLQKKPVQHTVLFIKEQLRCAVTLKPKNNIGVLYDRVSKFDNVMVQGLAGRCTGYDVPDFLVVFSNVDSILNYLSVIEGDFVDVGQLRYAGRGNTMVHPSVFMPDVSDVSTISSEAMSIDLTVSEVK